MSQPGGSTSHRGCHQPRPEPRFGRRRFREDASTLRRLHNPLRAITAPGKASRKSNELTFCTSSSAAGGGSPVAICGAMLVGLGFDPFRAAVICLIANTSPVAYGGLGTPILTLSGVTGISGERLSTMAGAHELGGGAKIGKRGGETDAGDATAGRDLEAVKERLELLAARGVEIGVELVEHDPAKPAEECWCLGSAAYEGRLERFGRDEKNAVGVLTRLALARCGDVAMPFPMPTFSSWMRSLRTLKSELIAGSAVVA